jgi:hypothetical protein
MMPRYYGNKYNVNIKMTSVYNKLCNKQYGLFSSSISYLHKGQDHQMNFSKYKNHLISSSHETYSFYGSFLILNLILQRQ